MVASVLHQKRRYLHLPILFYGTAQNKFLYLTNDLLTIIRFFLVTVNLNDMIKNQEFEFCLSIQCLELDYKSKKCSITIPIIHSFVTWYMLVIS